MGVNIDVGGGVDVCVGDVHDEVPERERERESVCVCGCMWMWVWVTYTMRYLCVCVCCNNGGRVKRHIKPHVKRINTN